MPLLLRDNARTNSFGRTRRKSTRRGTLTPCRAPMLLIQLHRLLWMWAAIIPTVSREMPGTCLDQTAEGSCSTRYVVARLFVRHAAMIAPPGPSSLGTAAPSKPWLVRCILLFYGLLFMRGRRLHFSSGTYDVARSASRSTRHISASRSNTSSFPRSRACRSVMRRCSSAGHKRRDLGRCRMDSGRNPADGTASCFGSTTSPRSSTC